MGNKLHQCSQPGCHKLISLDVRYCPNHKRDYDGSAYNKVRHADIKTNQRISFYKTKEWRMIREFVWQRDNGLCQYHLLIDDVAPGKIVDHIVPLQVDESLRSDENNLAVICQSCHNTKTDWEQKHYGTGFGNKIDKNAVKIKNIENFKFLFN